MAKIKVILSLNLGITIVNVHSKIKPLTNEKNNFTLHIIHFFLLLFAKQSCNVQRARRTILSYSRWGETKCKTRNQRESHRNYSTENGGKNNFYQSKASAVDGSIQRSVNEVIS